MRNQINSFIILLFLIPSIALASIAKVTDLHIYSSIYSARLTFNISKTVKYNIFSMRKPDRLIIDLPNIRLKHTHGMIYSKDIIKRIRSSEHKNGMLRIVLDLTGAVNYHSYWANPKAPKLIIDLSLLNKPIKSVIVLPKHMKSRNIIIVIDPGHGGKDPGATGQRGTHEKNVVLAISKDLKKLLDKQYGFKAYLTRNGDYFISLRERLRIARHDRGDMFIAIHADAYKDFYAQGASVFALSEKGATSEAARWLAQKENESELGHVLADKSNTLRSVLIDLAQTASISTSLAIGDSIVHQLTGVTKLHHGFVEQAAFVVLKEPDIPSLLVETGFISNAQEELKLRNPNYQQKIAHALMLGIVNYFKHRPPRGTYVYKNFNLTIS